MSTMEAQVEVVEHSFVTAKTRASLCETLSCFNRHQGGVSNSKVDGRSVISGMLLDNFSGKSVHISSNTIVSRLATSSPGESRGMYGSRHEWGQNSLESQYPLVVIFGRGVFESYGLPEGIQPDIQYITAGFWIVTNMWSVRNDTKTDLVIRLQHVSAAGEPWMNRVAEHTRSHSTNSNTDTVRHQHLICHTTSDKTCRSCGVCSEQVYTEMWICLNYSCQNFCRSNEGLELPINNTLSIAFITAPRITTASVTPNLTREPRVSFQLSQSDEENKRNFRDFWRGDCCQRCRMASHSSSYAKQICSGCDYSRDVRPPIVPLSYYAENENHASTDSPTAPSLDYKVSSDSEDCVTAEPPTDGIEYYIYRFRLHLENEVIILRPKQAFRAAPHGVGKIYQELQLQKDTGDINVRRRVLGSNSSQIHLTRHMVEKYGREYNAGYGSGFIAFDDPRASVVEKMRSIVERAIRLELNSNLEFNEGVLCTYFTGMAMGIHADDEVGLGPYVASLALGASADMEFYMKPQYDSGRLGGTGLRILQNNPLIKGCQRRSVLLELNQRRDRGEIDQNEYETEWRNIIEQNRCPNKRSPRKILKFTQQHGDIVLQRGQGVQDYYFHSIKELSSLCRDSLTLRYIGDDHDTVGSSREKGKVNRKRPRS